jgi:hypothetical protein
VAYSVESGYSVPDAVINAKGKTNTELRDMIAARLGIGGIMMTVYSDPTYGWNATVMTAPTQAVGCQAVVERIAAELRAEGYKLKS